MENGAIRVVNYIDGMTDTFDAFGNKGDPVPVLRHRIEQLWYGHWVSIPVYHEEADGTLTQVSNG